MLKELEKIKGVLEKIEESNKVKSAIFNFTFNQYLTFLFYMVDNLYRVCSVNCFL